MVFYVVTTQMVTIMGRCNLQKMFGIRGQRRRMKAETQGVINKMKVSKLLGSGFNAIDVAKIMGIHRVSVQRHRAQLRKEYSITLSNDFFLRLSEPWGSSVMVDKKESNRFAVFFNKVYIGEAVRVSIRPPLKIKRRHVYGEIQIEGKRIEET